MSKTPKSISSIRFSDSKLAWFDEKAKSLSYFCKELPVCVSQKTIRELKKIGLKKNARFCLHSSPQSDFHEMLILEHQGKYYRPHKHAKKGESYHVIEGRLGVFVFDESGNVTDAKLLTSHGNFMYRIGGNMYHAILPLSKTVIYHESKLGPFAGENDSIYPDWAPDGENTQETAQFTQKLRKLLA